jgi:hypothetical protein
MRPASYPSLKPWMNSAAGAPKAAFLFFLASRRRLAFHVASSTSPVRFVARKPPLSAVVDGFLGQG